ncbi:MAG TPA: hypothetical protein VJS64_13350 [Pyrinomonadaceae bacterium]|nr:hypothetical protein [Pyrinomonadaceae bacterium]
MTKQIILTSNDQSNEQALTVEKAVVEPAGKKLFVEPTVSVPADVLEATTFFQAPTIESAST